jgi:signal transduction histidine kinase
MHGGTIGAESIYGTGSSFWFILPIEGPIRRASSVIETQKVESA